MPDAQLDILLRRLNQAFHVPAWHGPNLLGALRGVTPEAAAWRPGPARHNIWELAVHAAYWKYRVYRKLTDAPPRSFDVKGSDWFVRPDETTTAAWRDDVALLRTWHDRLCGAVLRFNHHRLGEQVGSGAYTFEDLIAGAAAHDVYHAGQIRLLRRLQQGAS